MTDRTAATALRLLGPRATALGTGNPDWVNVGIPVGPPPPPPPPPLIT